MVKEKMLELIKAAKHLLVYDEGVEVLDYETLTGEWREKLLSFTRVDTLDDFVAAHTNQVRILVSKPKTALDLFGERRLETVVDFVFTTSGVCFVQVGEDTATGGNNGLCFVNYGNINEISISETDETLARIRFQCSDEVSREYESDFFAENTGADEFTKLLTALKTVAWVFFKTAE